MVTTSVEVATLGNKTSCIFKKELFEQNYDLPNINVLACIVSSVSKLCLVALDHRQPMLYVVADKWTCIDE